MTIENKKSTHVTLAYLSLNDLDSFEVQKAPGQLKTWGMGAWSRARPLGRLLERAHTHDLSRVVFMVPCRVGRHCARG